MTVLRLALCLAALCPAAAPSQGLAQGLPGLRDIAPPDPQPAPPAEGFPSNVGQCWNIASLAPEAQGIRVVLSAMLGDDGRPVPDGIGLVEASAGSPAAVEQAVEAARRALIRCGHARSAGDVSAALAGRMLEITFDPSGGTDR